MNKAVIRLFLGRMIIIAGLLMLLPFMFAFIYQDSLRVKLSFASASALSLGFGLLMIQNKPKQHKFHAKEGLVACSLTWLVMSLIGGLPLYISGETKSFVDGFFELSSGFTTTGATIISNIEGLSYASLFWRSFSHFVGGMGVLVFAFVFMPKVEADSQYLARAEMTGPAFGKLTSSIKSTARILYTIYLVMTFVLTIVLMIFKMPFFDALCHAFSTAGTGGFGVKNNSIAYYQSPQIEWVLTIAMLAFGINFNLYYLLMLKKIKDFFKDEELKWYLTIFLAAILLIVISMWKLYSDKSLLIREAAFNVSSLISTTGFGTVDFSLWPVLPQFVLLLVTFIGSMGGSTAGGLKVIRVMLFAKGARAEMKRQREPARTVPVLINKKPVQQAAYRGLFGYVIMYIGVFTTLLLVLSFESPDFLTAFSSSTAIFNNVGPGMNATGPSGNYAFFSPLAKIVMSVAMIAGRLEVWPVVILFSKHTWNKA